MAPIHRGTRNPPGKRSRPAVGANFPRRLSEGATQRDTKQGPRLRKARSAARRGAGPQPVINDDGRRSSARASRDSELAPVESRRELPFTSLVELARFTPPPLQSSLRTMTIGWSIHHGAHRGVSGCSGWLQSCGRERDQAARRRIATSAAAGNTTLSAAQARPPNLYRARARARRRQPSSLERHS